MAMLAIWSCVYVEEAAVLPLVAARARLVGREGDAIDVGIAAGADADGLEVRRRSEQKLAKRAAAALEHDAALKGVIGDLEALGGFRRRGDGPALLEARQLGEQPAHLRGIRGEAGGRGNHPFSVLFHERNGVRAAFGDLDPVHLGGIERKHRLLRLEGVVVRPPGPEDQRQDELEAQYGGQFKAETIHEGQAPLVPSNSRYLRSDDCRRRRRTK